MGSEKLLNPPILTPRSLDKRALRCIIILEYGHDMASTHKMMGETRSVEHQATLKDAKPKLSKVNLQSLRKAVGVAHLK